VRRTDGPEVIGVAAGFVGPGGHRGGQDVLSVAPYEASIASMPVNIMVSEQTLPRAVKAGQGRFSVSSRLLRPRAVTPPVLSTA
jgi:hypothetical protein